MSGSGITQNTAVTQYLPGGRGWFSRIFRRMRRGARKNACVGTRLLARIQLQLTFYFSQSRPAASRMQGTLCKWTNYMSGTYLQRFGQSLQWCNCTSYASSLAVDQDGSRGGLSLMEAHQPITQPPLKSTRAVGALLRSRHVISTVRDTYRQKNTQVKGCVCSPISAPHGSPSVRHSDAWRKTGVVSEGIVHSGATAVGCCSRDLQTRRGGKHWEM